LEPAGRLAHHGAVQFFDIHLVGFGRQTAEKAAAAAALILALVLLRWLLRLLIRSALRGPRLQGARFWARQATNIALTCTGVLGLLSIVFDDPSRLATAVGVVTAGVAFALQKVITSLAGYLVILRGNTFSIGDRIAMGGVRGDVIGLGFVRTTIMEMGEPPPVTSAGETGAGGTWVHGRQWTGRVVTVTNDKLFDEPVYNYTHAFPYLWEEVSIPVPYSADRARAESILLEAAQRHAVPSDSVEEALLRMRRRYTVHRSDIAPTVYWRLTDNWLEMSVRFLVPERGIREVKSAISREVIAGLDAAGIPIASSTYDIVGMPQLRVETGPAPG
jgi:small-conductance mechanosensitive channel